MARRIARQQRRLQEVADGVWQLSLAPREALNVFVVGDVLVDAGWPRQAPTVLRAIADVPIGAHVVTHAHVDHVGASRSVVEARGIPMWASTADADAVEAGRAVVPDAMPRLLQRIIGRFPPVRVDRRLREGDQVANGFEVLEVPGHSPGHIALWRAADGVLICGDVMSNVGLVRRRSSLSLPPGLVTPDPSANRSAAVRLAELRPDLTLFAHGTAMRGSRELAAYVRHLESR